MISHDESLDMKNRRAMECYEASTLESLKKDSIYEHGSFILVIPQKPCSFNVGVYHQACSEIALAVEFVGRDRLL